MDLIRQYIVQCITSAANNLRLNTEKIEVVSLLREYICRAGDLETEIRNMKKITQLSTFAIKLGDIYNYIAKSKVDFFKISEKFKEHCSSLVKDLSGVLDKLNPQSFRQVTESMKDTFSKPEATKDNTIPSGGNGSAVKNETIDPRSRIERTGEILQKPVSKTANPVAEAEKIKEEYLLETEKKTSQVFFENYEERILSPIKDIDLLLKKVAQNQAPVEEIKKFREIIVENAEISSSIGFEIIAAMHRVLAKALKLINEEKIVADKELISGMRASLIVIVAVVRSKDVDITGYLNKAEELGKRIQNLK
ncbi:MAG: hypothetical protein Q8933_03370 [Bacteroidota bacterium]|nr:hypothetical protein [Bacteroidota bacterium]